MKLQHVLTLGLATLALSACGAGSGDQAKALGGALAKMNTLNSEGAARINLRAMSRRLKDARSKAEGQLLLAKFAQEAGQTARLEEFTVSDEQVSCALTTDSDAGTSGTLSCETLADDTFTCGDIEYTMKEGGTIAMTFAITDTLFSYGMNLDATIGGGAFGDGTAFDCNFGFSFTAAELEALASGGGDAFDCSDFDYSCSIGGTTIQCEDLKTAFAEESNACS
jgi:hypothetical protein